VPDPTEDERVATGAGAAWHGKVRRVVTGVDDEGRSFVLSDTLLPTDAEPDGGFTRIAFWLTDRAPASNLGLDDPVPDGRIEHVVPMDRGGTVIRVVDVPPEVGWRALPSLMEHPGVTQTAERARTHPGFHKTDTVDYVVCLDGEILMLLDEDEVLLRPGDVLIQRGTQHAWSNRSDRTCRLLIVMVDAEPLERH
jgi:hypothetical protein